MISVRLNDGSEAVLQAISQTNNYRRGFLEPPADALQQLKSIANIWKPPAWPAAHMVVVEPPRISAAQLLRDRGRKWMYELPPILCVGCFRSFRGGAEVMKATFLEVVWLQDELDPHIGDDNRAVFAALDWDTLAGFKADAGSAPG